MTELTVHYWNFGCKTACGSWEYVDGEKLNPLDDSIENVTCENCKRAYTRRYIDSREACLGINPYAVRPSIEELLDRCQRPARREGAVTTTICEHENFRSTVVVNRLVNGYLDFSAEVKIKCADCGRPFVFLGLPMGLVLQGAAISFDAQEARLAIKPSSTEGNVL